ncbi:MAG TPA: lactate racemase domain-containing protein [Spirochaetota bacterium]|nr:lactate racemase domain-containing protein [Spirochaetota bacterium]
MLLPRLYMLEGGTVQNGIDDIDGAVLNALSRRGLEKIIRPGDTVALTAGSRGIRYIDTITAGTVRHLDSMGAKPFIVPAMGSHGGGTAEGQRAILAGYGITEEAMGCEIRSSMEVVEIGTTALGTPVFIDAHAAAADHIGVINRVKPHTRLSGSIESGLVKMCMIGLGKREGAATYHRAIERHSWMEIVRSLMDVVLEKSPVRFGLGIVQNAHEEIARVEALLPGEFLTGEAKLLEEARSLMGTLPSNDIDLLIVDEMGKEISGTGMDASVIGRKDGSPVRVGRIFVRDITAATNGNAQGIGLADFTTRRLVEKIDLKKLYLNSRTAYRTDTCKIPMTFDTDREAMEVALWMAGTGTPDELRLMWIRNTLRLDTIAVSAPLLERPPCGPGFTIVRGPMDIVFDADGRLQSPFAHER